MTSDAGYAEVAALDGYITTKVPLNHIGFLDVEDLKERIAGVEAARYGHYADLIANGHYVNGLPIVYRNRRGMMVASDLRHSDIAIYAEQNVRVRSGVPKNTVHPLIGVKIIEASGRADIAAQRAAYLEKNT